MLGFFLAGHETSSHTLSFTLMELAQNQEIQSSLYEEIKNVDLHQDNLNDALLPLKKLENCVKEAQRLHAGKWLQIHSVLNILHLLKS